MLPRPQEIENLLKLADAPLKEAAPDSSRIEGYRQNATDFLRAAKRTDDAPVVRYTSAYEGIFMLAMCLLSAYGTRTSDKPGHRSIALELMISRLWPADAGVYKTLMDAHKVRNAAIYESPVPCVTRGQAEALTELLNDATERIDRLLASA